MVELRLLEDNTAALVGPVVQRDVPRLHTELDAWMTGSKSLEMQLDLSGVDKIDTAGAAMIRLLFSDAIASRRRLRVVAWSPTAREALALFDEPAAAGGDGPENKRSLVVRLGDATYGFWQQSVAFASLVTDTVWWSFGGAARTRRVRKGAFVGEANRIGVDSLPIVGLVSFLVGAVVALQSAYQLRQFGANIYVANLIAVSMTREMGPLMTAILIAGRSGAAIAAEIATMQVSEEIDGLRTMGLNPIRYIVVPKFQAITLTMPTLTVYANCLGIIGGFLVAFFYLGLGVEVFFGQVADALMLKDVLTGLCKSVVFAWLIVLVSSQCGFSARGGAESVGRVTTQSVVSSIFWVIVADALFSLIFYFGD